MHDWVPDKHTPHLTRDIINLRFLERSPLACIYTSGDHFHYPRPLTDRDLLPLLQMDHVHKALIGPSFGLTLPLKRKASSCGVCRLRFNSEVGVVLWETRFELFFFQRAFISHTHPWMTVVQAEETCPCFVVLLVLRSWSYLIY